MDAIANRIPLLQQKQFRTYHLTKALNEDKYQCRSLQVLFCYMLLGYFSPVTIFEFKVITFAHF